MLINIQSMLKIGHTLVALIFMSNRIHLSNFACNKNEWPVYLAITNPSSMINKMPATHSVVMVPLLPIAVKNCNLIQMWRNQHCQENLELLMKVLQWTLQPPSFKHNLSSETTYYNVPCSDGTFQHCKPVIVAWLAGCPKYSNLHHLQGNVRF